MRLHYICKSAYLQEFRLKIYIFFRFLPLKRGFQFSARMERKALIKPSRSPSITFWMFPFSYSVR